MNKSRKLTSARLFQWAGVFAILAGVLYIAIQMLHPSDHLSSVNTVSWVVVSSMTIAMALCSLIGTTAIYLKQVEETGWLGLIGFIGFGLFWLITLSFSLIEGFVLPLITTEASEFVEGMVGLFGDATSEAPLGIFPILAPIAGVLYLLGGLLLGIATCKAKVFPRMAGALLSLSAVITLASAVIPHPLDRILAVPMGVTFIWFGFILWAKQKRRQETSS